MYGRGREKEGWHGELVGEIKDQIRIWIVKNRKRKTEGACSLKNTASKRQYTPYMSVSK